MKRRHFIVLTVAAALPTVLGAQQLAKLRRVGILSSLTPSTSAAWNESLKRGLRELGWLEGQNIAFEYRYAEGKSDRLPDLAHDLLRLKVDVIVTAVTPEALAAKHATKAVPIVMASAGDPIATKLVESLARPGGNVTGLSAINSELGGKRLELLKEVAPRLATVAVLWNPQSAVSTVNWNETQASARRLGLRLQSLEVRNVNDFEGRLADAARAQAGALAVMPDPVFAGNLKLIAELAAKNGLPSIYLYSEFPEAGGLLSYGPDRADLFRRAASFVDKVLKGAKPGDLPVELPTKFELVVNRKTARAIGLTVPQSLLVRADRVIA
jgi:putative ABC transport system substrate-binding protein